MVHDFKKFPELTNKQLESMFMESPHKQITTDFMANVVKVTDGDTIRLKTDFRDFTFPLRLANIDAPEMNNGGEKARDWLINEIEGKNIMVIINKDNRVGKYGRLIGEVLFNGLNMGDTEKRLGLVVEFGKKNEGIIRKIPESVAYFNKSIKGVWT